MTSSISKLSFILFLAIIYTVHQSYNVRVDSMDFAVIQRRKINADSAELFDFLSLTHILEKVFKIIGFRLITWFPASARLKEADAKTFGIGKYFQVFFKVPLMGEWNMYLITTDYKRGKLLILESKDDIFHSTFEIRTNNYHDKTMLQVTMCFNKSSALFHYTIGRYLRSITKLRFEETIIFVEEMYKATEKYRELT